MESDNPRICTWCGKDLLSVPAVVTGKSPHIVTTRHIPTAKHGPARLPLTRPVRPEPPPAPPPAEKTQPASSPAATHTGHVPPPIGTFQAQKSKYYTDKVIDTVSGAHYDADTGQSTDVVEIEIVEVEVNEKKQTLIYVGLLILIIAASVGLAKFFAGGYLVLLALSNFLGGMLMPVLRAVPFMEDDPDDLALAIALILILGPLVGAMAYGVFWIMRQDANPAIIGVFLTYLCIRIPLDLASGIPFDRLFYGMMPFTELSLPFFTKQWMAFATLGGWICAGMFKKPDE